MLRLLTGEETEKTSTIPTGDEYTKSLKENYISQLAEVIARASVAREKAILDPVSVEAIIGSEKSLFRCAITSCNLPKYVRKVVEEHFKKTDTYKILRSKMAKILSSEGHFLLAHGPGGTGKTIALARLMVELVASEKVSLSGGAMVLASDLTIGHEDSLVLQQSRSAGILLLDDIGTETIPRGVERVLSILLHRHTYGKLTLLTSNLKPEELANRYDQRVVDRFAEAGAIVACTETIRQKGSK
jgi:hypothetical protein